MCYLETVVRDDFVTRTCSPGQGGKGMGLALRAIVAEGMTDVERSKSHQFTSRVNTQRTSHDCRSCENDCMIRVVMANAVKPLLNNLPLMPLHLLL